MNDKNKESIKSDLVMMYEGALYELAVTPFVLGRDQISSDLWIQNKTVSRNHVRLTQNEGRWYVEDLHSSSGTLLNGVKIDSGRKYEIVAGDCLEVANAMVDFLQVNTQDQEDEKTGRLGSASETEKPLKPVAASRQPAESLSQKKNEQELNHLKSTLRQFLSENAFDQRGLNRLNKIVKLVRTFSGEDEQLDLAVQELIQESARQRNIPIKKTVESAPEKSVSPKIIPGNQNSVSQDKLPIFHPVKVEGDWVQIPVTKIPFTIGRGPENVDFVLRAAGISRSHCLVSCHSGTYHITDLGSTNGMFLNKKPLKPNDNYPIKNGDSVSFGVNQFYLEIP